MKTLKQIISEIKDLSQNHPILQDRINALKEVGYDDIHYGYVKHGKGLFTAIHLPKKQLYRIQISHTEVQKGYPAAWFIDVPSINVVDVVELPF